MKQLLILSFLLLSFPLLGQSKGTDVLYIWENGTRYIGEWKDGKQHGQGTYTYGKGEGEGDKYVGEFKSGYRNGQGSYTWFSDEKYKGEFKDGYRDGQGTYTWSSGKKYIGKWKDGVRHGLGTYTFYDGGKYVGEFFNGKMWNGTKYDENGDFSYKLVNGK